MRKLLWLAVSSLMALSLVMAACAPTAPTTPATPTAPTTPTTPIAPTQEKPQQETVKPTAEVPRYGGTLTYSLAGDVTSFDIYTTSFAPGVTVAITNESLVEGDWTKGPAGGYGSKETDWGMGYDVLSLKMGLLAESWKWSADFAKNEASLVYQIRQGVKFALNPDSEASRLAAGRQMTADDVVYSILLQTQDSRAYLYRAVPQVRTASVTKTGPWEVTIKTTADFLMSAFQRLNYFPRVAPPEVVKKYGDMANWRNSVGTGSFMLVNNVPGSLVEFKKNPNYWMKDPIGPGKGNQLPYIDAFRYLIIPDASTRQAALRTGKIDGMLAVSWEDAPQFRKTTPQLLEFERPIFGGGAFSLRVDIPPFNDVRVRRALLMATDLETIRKGLNGGLGQIHTWPWPATKGYEATYLALDDPKTPESVRELYTYNPEKAKQLLSEAGYPKGLKTAALMTSDEVDYYSILKDQWAKVGIEMEFMIRETGAKNALLAAGTHAPITVSGVPQARMYYFLVHLTGTDGIGNPSMIRDPYINETIARIGRLLITDEKAAMKIWGDELMAYVLRQVYAIPRAVAPQYNMWWPWLKNYSGEVQVGESLRHEYNWVKYLWIDQELKKKMGY